MSSVHFKRHIICTLKHGGNTDLNKFLEAHLKSRTQSDQSKALLKISRTCFKHTVCSYKPWTTVWTKIILTMVHSFFV